jgi:hypothetical protein
MTIASAGDWEADLEAVQRDGCPTSALSLLRHLRGLVGGSETLDNTGNSAKVRRKLEEGINLRYPTQVPCL